MEIVLLISSISNILCFLIGAKIGQKTIKGEDIEINPIKVIKEDIEEAKINKEIELQNQEFKKELENIDNYDGTSINQKEL